MPCLHKRFENHPHVYGEYLHTVLLREMLVESPPCVWGVPEGLKSQYEKAGITPMCMGSTKTEIDNVLDTQNHPHVYGEYKSTFAVKRPTKESPPCVWGVPFCLSGFLSIQRITPMCMGSTQLNSK